MRLASAAVGGCVVVAGGEVNTTHNDASGVVDMLCEADAEDATEGGADGGDQGEDQVGESRSAGAGAGEEQEEADWQVAELSARRYELAAASLSVRFKTF